ncbi:hypothetical protein KC850_03745 [Candidatus Kaiserbacteria bacterium]|nr:hypothetical protein [Candidatus Kaiserbacteria bacterium]MCB9818343.1 hypothetical protein [Candidatus Nomurabacteria bacterium]
MANDDSDLEFELISFVDLVKHTLLDMFEFSAHSFESIQGPYYWNGLGMDFMTSMPTEKVLKHAEQEGAKKVYLAHTHPLSNDDVCKFLNIKVDPREEMAFGYKALPLGNKPSSGDISFLSQFQKDFEDAGIEVSGVVFSATGLWEFSIVDILNFNSDKFVGAYDVVFPIEDSEDFFDELSARSAFPSYFMELQKPKIRDNSYQTQLDGKRDISPVDYNENIESIVKFFGDNGIRLKFYLYSDFNINPQQVMADTIDQWSGQFTT